MLKFSGTKCTPCLYVALEHLSRCQRWMNGFLLCVGGWVGGVGVCARMCLVRLYCAYEGGSQSLELCCLLPLRRPLHCGRWQPPHEVFPKAVKIWRLPSTTNDLGNRTQGQMVPVLSVVVGVVGYVVGSVVVHHVHITL